MPPEIMMGVRAMARSPSSTLKRSISIKLVQTRNRGAISENKNTSAINATNNHRSPLGRDDGPPERALKRVANLRMLVTIEPCQTDRDRNQDDGALDRFLPISADAQEGETRADGPEQDHTQQSSQNCARTAGDRGPAHDHGGDHFHLHTQPGIAGDLMETDGVDGRGQPGEDTG